MVNTSNKFPERIVDENILIIKLRGGIASKFRKWLKGKSAGSSKMVEGGGRLLFYLVRVYPVVLYLLFQQKFFPQLIVCNVPLFFPWVKLLPWKKKYIIGSLYPMIQLAEKGLDAESFLSNPIEVVPETLNLPIHCPPMERVVFNSNLTAEIASRLSNLNYRKNVLYFNFVPEFEFGYVEFPSRKYEMAFIASDFRRKVKNSFLAYTIFEKFYDKQKIVVGSNMEEFSSLMQTEIIPLISQKSIIRILHQTKLLVITSFFDSSPSVMSEAILSGCNVLVSKNVGWSELLPDECVVQEYKNLNEWVLKAKWLIENPIEYPAIQSLSKSAENEILNWVERS